MIHVRFPAIGLATCLALSACGRAPADPDAIVRTLAVGDMLPGLDPVGVAFDDLDREVLVLDSASRVFVFDESGAFLAEHDLSAIAWSLSAIAAIPGTDEVLVTSPATVVGLRVDLSTEQVVYDFCLLPGEGPGNILHMEELGLAYDDGSDRIVAAPYWVDDTTGEVVSSALETYDGATGELLTWQDLGGHAVEALDVDDATGELRMVDEGVLYRWVPGEGSGALGHREELRDLGRDLGVGLLRSFARDRALDHHWLLDLGAMEVIEAR